MLRYLKLAFLAAVGLVLFVLAIANRDVVVLRLIPDEAAGLLPVPNQIAVPLFVVLFGGVLLGLLIGFVWEWFREHRQRAEAARRAKRLERLEAEVQGLRETHGAPGEDILALADGR